MEYWRKWSEDKGCCIVSADDTSFFFPDVLCVDDCIFVVEYRSMFKHDYKYCYKA